jgi:hypothetical protein
MLNRSLGWMLVALGLGSLHPMGASAQGDPSASLPAGVTACKLAALVKETEPGGPAIRDAPRQDGREVGRLPTLDDNRPAYGHVVELPEIQVVGFKDGWFLIEGAAYPEPYPSQIYTGRGWVQGKSVTTHLFRDTLKKAPSNDSPDVSHLYRTYRGIPQQPYDLEVQRVVSCSGPWLEVEVHQPDGKTVPGKPASTADGTVRGWTDRSCTEQRNGPCRGVQFDYPWSPLPAGVTECNFRALSNDPDSAGLNVRDAPDRNARVLGRLPPRDIASRLQTTGSFIVRAEVQVIGYRNGWFLIEAGGAGPPYYEQAGPRLEDNHALRDERVENIVLRRRDVVAGVEEVVAGDGADAAERADLARLAGLDQRCHAAALDLVRRHRGLRLEMPRLLCHRRTRRQRAHHGGLPGGQARTCPAFPSTATRASTQ